MADMKAGRDGMTDTSGSPVGDLLPRVQGSVTRTFASQEHMASLFEKIHRLRQPVIAAVNGPAHGGGFAIACTRDATREQTRACYPQLAGFLAEQRRIDPQQRWVNGWLRHQRNLLEREPCEVRWGT